jgi:hypothetical protein
LAEVTERLRSLPQQAHPLGTLLLCDSDLVGILERDRHRRLIALRDIARGTHLFRITGREHPKPTRYSVQVSATLHLDQDGARDEFELVRRYFWRYLDHACEPTTRILDREVIAVRDIAAGEGVTFHYCTTEYDMASPFACLCGGPRCMGVIRGARHLTAAQRRRLAKWMPDYLRRDPVGPGGEVRAEPLIPGTRARSRRGPG